MTMSVDMPTTAISKPVKMKSIGWPIRRLMNTSTGATNIATWVDDPTAISSVTLRRFLIAKRTAEACSAALPMTGMRMRPTKTAGT